jgi:hypothetical protein
MNYSLTFEECEMLLKAAKEGDYGAKKILDDIEYWLKDNEYKSAKKNTYIVKFRYDCEYYGLKEIQKREIEATSIEDARRVFEHNIGLHGHQYHAAHLLSLHVKK